MTQELQAPQAGETWVLTGKRKLFSDFVAGKAALKGALVHQLLPGMTFKVLEVPLPGKPGGGQLIGIEILEEPAVGKKGYILSAWKGESFIKPAEGGFWLDVVDFFQQAWSYVEVVIDEVGDVLSCQPQQAPQGNLPNAADARAGWVNGSFANYVNKQRVHHGVDLEANIGNRIHTMFPDERFVGAWRADFRQVPADKPSHGRGGCVTTSCRLSILGEEQLLLVHYMHIRPDSSLADIGGLLQTSPSSWSYNAEVGQKLGSSFLVGRSDGSGCRIRDGKPRYHLHVAITTAGGLGKHYQIDSNPHKASEWARAVYKKTSPVVNPMTVDPIRHLRLGFDHGSNDWWPKDGRYVFSHASNRAPGMPDIDAGYTWKLTPKKLILEVYSTMEDIDSQLVGHP